MATGKNNGLCDVAGYAKALAGWFSVNARELPWRQERSLYRTVVSEFMLQQTQVATVVPYFERWMRELPDFEALATADEEGVLKLWEGLGYYRRARNLHKLARQWVAAEDKPVGATAWLAYPGVGAYTAAAIASIAQGEHAAVVDGNVVRILARLTADGREFADGVSAAKTFAPVADSLIADAPDPAVHNEAMMELGATVCLRAKPLCLLCPVRDYCAGVATGSPEAFPRLRPKPTVQRTVCRLWLEGPQGLLLYKGAAGARRLAGLYELPEASLLLGDGAQPAGELLKTGRRGIAQERIVEPIYRMKLDAEHQDKIQACPELVWIARESLETITLTGPHRRWVRELAGL